MKSRLVRIGIVVFFLGLPYFGLIYFWKDAHRKIEASATPVAHQMTLDILGKWDTKLLDDLGTLQFRQSNEEAEFVKAKDTFGQFQGLSDWKLIKSVAGSREDMVWQLVHFSGKAYFEKGDGTVLVTIARRTMSPEWRVESFVLKR